MIVGSGVMSAPPPTPVSPTTKTTMKPAAGDEKSIAKYHFIVRDRKRPDGIRTSEFPFPLACREEERPQGRIQLYGRGGRPFVPADGQDELKNGEEWHDGAL